MPAITLVQICDAISNTLSPAVTRAQSVNELREQISDTNLLQVYPEALAGVDVLEGTADRRTFGGKGGVEEKPVRLKTYTIHADYYAQPRKVIGENMQALAVGIDAIEIILEDQDVKPYFGLVGIEAFQWSWNRVTFTYGDPQLQWVGARFVINVVVF